jgi:hypothetical protein
MVVVCGNNGTSAVMLMVKIFFCIGKLRDAVACYERAIQLQPDTIENHKVEKINMPMFIYSHFHRSVNAFNSILQSLMSCWITLGQVSTALEHANGVLTKRFVSLEVPFAEKTNKSWFL